MEVSFRWQNFPGRDEPRQPAGRGRQLLGLLPQQPDHRLLLDRRHAALEHAGGLCVSRASAFPGAMVLFVLVLATMMLPFQVTMIPLYLLFNEYLHWGDTLPAAHRAHLLRQRVRRLPAAPVLPHDPGGDVRRGAGGRRLGVADLHPHRAPLSVPVLATVTVFTFLWAWNDFTGSAAVPAPARATSPWRWACRTSRASARMVWNQLMAASSGVHRADRDRLLLRPEDLHPGHQADRDEGMRVAAACASHLRHETSPFASWHSMGSTRVDSSARSTGSVSGG